MCVVVGKNRGKGNWRMVQDSGYKNGAHLTHQRRDGIAAGSVVTRPHHKVRPPRCLAFSELFERNVCLAGSHLPRDYFQAIVTQAIGVNVRTYAATRYPARRRNTSWLLMSSESHHVGLKHVLEEVEDKPHYRVGSSSFESESKDLSSSSQICFHPPNQTMALPNQFRLLLKRERLGRALSTNFPRR